MPGVGPENTWCRPKNGSSGAPRYSQLKPRCSSVSIDAPLPAALTSGRRCRVLFRRTWVETCTVTAPPDPGPDKRRPGRVRPRTRAAVRQQVARARKRTERPCLSTTARPFRGALPGVPARREPAFPRPYAARTLPNPATCHRALPHNWFGIRPRPGGAGRPAPFFAITPRRSAGRSTRRSTSSRSSLL
jgi:hypothetical protein